MRGGIKMKPAIHLAINIVIKVDFFLLLILLVTLLNLFM